MWEGEIWKEELSLSILSIFLYWEHLLYKIEYVKEHAYNAQLKNDSKGDHLKERIIHCIYRNM